MYFLTVQVQQLFIISDTHGKKRDVQNILVKIMNGGKHLENLAGKHDNIKIGRVEYYRLH